MRRSPRPSWHDNHHASSCRSLQVTTSLVSERKVISYRHLSLNLYFRPLPHQIFDLLSHLLFDKHYGEQSEIVDTIAERIQLLGGVSIAMAADVAETTRIARPPRGREEVPVQISRLLDAHQIIIGHCRELAKRADQIGDDGTNDLAVSDVLRTNELQVWFLSQHLVDEPLVRAEDTRLRDAS